VAEESGRNPNWGVPRFGTDPQVAFITKTEDVHFGDSAPQDRKVLKPRFGLLFGRFPTDEFWWKIWTKIIDHQAGCDRCKVATARQKLTFAPGFVSDLVLVVNLSMPIASHL
jgi:hypothetical protein